MNRTCWFDISNAPSNEPDYPWDEVAEHDYAVLSTPAVYGRIGGDMIDLREHLPNTQVIQYIHFQGVTLEPSTDWVYYKSLYETWGHTALEGSNGEPVIAWRGSPDLAHMDPSNVHPGAYAAWLASWIGDADGFMIDYFGWPTPWNADHPGDPVPTDWQDWLIHQLSVLRYLRRRLPKAILIGNGKRPQFRPEIVREGLLDGAWWEEHGKMWGPWDKSLVRYTKRLPGLHFVHPGDQQLCETTHALSDDAILVVPHA